MQTKFILKKYHGYTESFFPKHGLYLDNGKGHFTTACYSAFSKKIYFKYIYSQMKRRMMQNSSCLVRLLLS